MRTGMLSFLCAGVLCAVTSVAQARDNPEPEKGASVVFNSAVPLMVFEISRPFDDQPILVGGRLIGRTPSPSGVIVPNGVFWAIEPSEAHFGDEDLKRLAESIREFRVPGLRLMARSRITDSGLQHLGKLDCLEYLDLSSLTVTDQSMRTIGTLTNLRCLRLVCLDGVSEKGLENLGKLPHLVQLELGGLPVTDDTIARFAAAAPQLEALGISGDQITPLGIQKLGALKELRCLDLRGVRITKADATVLGGLKKLVFLDLKGTSLDDGSLEDLSRLKRLRTLILSFNADISDAGVRHLETLQALTSLELRGTSVTWRAVEFLEDRIPDVNIEHDRRGWADEQYIGVAVLALVVVSYVLLRIKFGRKKARSGDST